jgi:predicted ATPase
MFNHIHLKNFKSIRTLDLELSPLTVLAGLNGSGKSSVLQAIALIKQSIDEDHSCAQLVLDGPIVSLGYGSDILHEAADDDTLGIRFSSLDDEFSWLGAVDTNRDVVAADFSGDSHKLEQQFQGFQYIQANRIVPTNQYQLATSKLRDLGSLGSHGEFTVDFMARNDSRKVPKSRILPKSRLKDEQEVARFEAVAPTDFLPDAVSAWLQMLSPGARAIANNVELSLSASLKFEYKGFSSVIRDIESRQHRPSNVGFGLTYSLPILVACLTAEPGAVILLENPEAHLHPRGQSALGLLLAQCANDGVQIIVETHSDHLLNGIRVANKQGFIKADDVSTHFFTRNVESGVSEVETPFLLSGGRMSDWPVGFFDEWNNALDELLDFPAPDHLAKE